MGQHQQSRLNETKLFKLRTIAFSYSDYVDLYCSGKGETLHIQNLHVHFRLHSHQVINSVFKSWFVYFELCCVRRISPGDSKSWESPDEADIVYYLLTEFAFRTVRY